MKNNLETLAAVVLFIIVWGGTFLYSKGVTDQKINDLRDSLVTSQDFAKQQEQVKNLVKSNENLSDSVEHLTNRLDRLMELMLNQR